MSAPLSLVYFGLYDRREAPGVDRKVTGLLSAAAAIGFATRSWSEPFVGTQPLWRLAAEISGCRDTHLILRSLGFANLFLIPALLRARRRGTRIVLDVPSPNRVAIREIWNSRQSRWRRVRGVTASYLSGPWSFWPAHHIVQYAREGWWFRLGNASRTVEIGNGIDVGALRPRPGTPAWPASVLRLIAVATVADWHGYDRLLRAMRAFHQDSTRTFDLHLTIAGRGPVQPQLEELARTLGLQLQVTFAGMLDGDALAEAYASSHLAVSSLALHRIGLENASVLKAREYCAVGIPFIAAGTDPDFTGDVPFRFVVSADEDTRSVTDAFKAFDRQRSLFTDRDLRQYAIDRLDWRHKLAQFRLIA